MSMKVCVSVPRKYIPLDKLNEYMESINSNQRFSAPEATLFDGTREHYYINLTVNQAIELKNNFNLEELRLASRDYFRATGPMQFSNGVKGVMLMGDSALITSSMFLGSPDHWLYQSQFKGIFESNSCEYVCSYIDHENAPCESIPIEFEGEWCGFFVTEADLEKVKVAFQDINEEENMKAAIEFAKKMTHTEHHSKSNRVNLPAWDNFKGTEVSDLKDI